jgi:hypothetical protein
MEPVNLHTLWCTAITRTLGGLKLLLVGEVDCVKGINILEQSEIHAHGSVFNGVDDYEGDPKHYLELKTRLPFIPRKQ